MFQTWIYLALLNCVFKNGYKVILIYVGSFLQQFLKIHCSLHLTYFANFTL